MTPAYKRCERKISAKERVFEGGKREGIKK
jgi:hypothetical protein